MPKGLVRWQPTAATRFPQINYPAAKLSPNPEMRQAPRCSARFHHFSTQITLPSANFPQTQKCNKQWSFSARPERYGLGKHARALCQLCSAAEYPTVKSNMEPSLNRRMDARRLIAHLPNLSPLRSLGQRRLSSRMARNKKTKRRQQGGGK